MSRLIDADKLIEHMKRQCVDNCLRCDWLTILTNEPYCGLIDNQPTAYDVEAVVRELGELFNAYLENVLIQREREGRHYVNAMHIFEKTIEIVERGGRNE